MAEDDAAHRIDRDDSKPIERTLLRKLRASSERSARTCGAKQIIEFSVQSLEDFLHGSPVCRWIGETAILIGPECAIKQLEDFMNPFDPRLEKLTGELIRFSNQVQFCSIRLQEALVLRSSFRIDNADETQSQIKTNLGQPNPEIAGARF